MAKNYSALVQKLKQRTNPDFVNESTLFSMKFTEEIGQISYNDALVYVKRAMKGVGQEYTDRSIEAGDNVKNHLNKILTDVSFKYQGSVMTNTHIIGNSDIDLLAISEKSYYYSPSEVNATLNIVKSSSPVNEAHKNRLTTVLQSPGYVGDTLEDLRTNRIYSEAMLNSMYQKCNTEKPKAIEITNLNLNRDVDVVIAIWHHSADYIASLNSDYKKITVYDKDSHSTGRQESPFLSIKKINDRDNLVNGRLKKMIRFIKNVKIDSAIEEIPLSSFEINAICFGINPVSYVDKNFLELVEVALKQMVRLSNDEVYRNVLKSVDGSEFIFKDQPKKLEGLRTLLMEVQIIANDVLTQLETVKLLRA